MPYNDNNVSITYIDQNIPSPCGMPSFELVTEYTSDIFNLKAVPMSALQVDTSGRRVDAYARMVILSLTVRSLIHVVPSSQSRPFHFQPDGATEAMTKCNIFRLNKNKLKDSTEAVSFYGSAAAFQCQTTACWRGKVPIASLLIPPVSPEDETTNAGAAKVVLSLLVLYGIIEIKKTRGKEQFVLADNYKERKLMLIGDGLSQIRVKTFCTLMANKSYSNFDEEHENNEVIQRALGQIINVTGDLHGGCFHFLSALYSLYYGSLIQPIQALLGWKRIRGSDVTKCYQQAAGLAILIAEELDRQLFGSFLVSKTASGNFGVIFESHDHPRAAAVFIAEQYEQWLTERRRNCADECFSMSLNFLYLMKLYRMFRLSLRNGDAIMIEWLYRTFLPIFHVCGKSNYVMIVMDMMDQLYHNVSGKELHMIRVNRTTPLHKGVDRNGAPMANWPLDGVIELMQKFYHEMAFENNDIGWLRHSSHIMLKSEQGQAICSKVLHKRHFGSVVRYTSC
jgi:hypothetical protein